MEAKACEVYRDAASSDEACGEEAAWRITVAAPVGDGSVANHYYVYVCAEHVAQFRERNAGRIIEEQALVGGYTTSEIKKLVKSAPNGILRDNEGNVIASLGAPFDHVTKGYKGASDKEREAIIEERIEALLIAAAVR